METTFLSNLSLSLSLLKPLQIYIENIRPHEMAAAFGAQGLGTALVVIRGLCGLPGRDAAGILPPNA
jgi:hypothetical protein